MSEEKEQIESLLRCGGRDAVEQFLVEHKPSTAMLNQGMFAWGAPPLAVCGNVETAQLLIDHGADPRSLGDWWKPGFGARNVVPDVAKFLVTSGAELSPHAASALGLHDDLVAMIGADANVVHAKGGDGCTPLHFARDIATAELLLDAGANLDAIDDDHKSTPMQWLVGDAPDVTQHLIHRGATADIFVLAALGEADRMKEMIESSPNTLSHRVGKLPFPPIGHEGLGGTILQWTLGFNSYAHQYAKSAGHHELFDTMYSASDSTTQFLVSCVMANRKEAERLKADQPSIVDDLEPEDLELLARYCWETNVNIEAVRLMLDVGFPINHAETSHGHSPLHNAAWGGYADLVELLIERGSAVDSKDPSHGGTPIGWALHCCLRDGRHPEGQYARVVASLVDAGCAWDRDTYPTGHNDIDAELKKRMS